MLRSAFRFGLVGIVNTVAGILVIGAFIRAGLGDFTANALGYCVCIGLSFALNRSFTFGVRGTVRGQEVRRYLTVFALAYGANLATLALMRGAGFAGSMAAQIAAMMAYSASFFLLSRYFVFASGRHA